jgi:hypothetical protein
MGSTIQVKDVHVRMTIPLIDSDVRDGSATTKIVGSFKEMAVGVKEVAENEVCVVVSLWVQVLDDAPCSVVVRTIESQPRSSSWKIVRLRIELKGMHKNMHMVYRKFKTEETGPESLGIR